MIFSILAFVALFVSICRSRFMVLGDLILLLIGIYEVYRNDIKTNNHKERER